MLSPKRVRVFVFSIVSLSREMANVVITRAVIALRGHLTTGHGSSEALTLWLWTGWSEMEFPSRLARMELDGAVPGSRS